MDGLVGSIKEALGQKTKTEPIDHKKEFVSRS